MVDLIGALFSPSSGYIFSTVVEARDLAHVNIRILKRNPIYEWSKDNYHLVRIFKQDDENLKTPKTRQ